MQSSSARNDRPGAKQRYLHRDMRAYPLELTAVRISTVFQRLTVGEISVRTDANDQYLSTWPLRLSIYPTNEQTVKRALAFLSNVRITG